VESPTPGAIDWPSATTPSRGGEMVNAADLKSAARKGIRVQVPSPALRGQVEPRKRLERLSHLRSGSRRGSSGDPERGDALRGPSISRRGSPLGKPFGQPFGVDVAFGDPILGEPDIVVADDVLAFAGITPPTLRLYPIETHIAEKLHAYTMPRSRPNSRVKDLPDLALLASAQPLEGSRVRAALAQTFGSSEGWACSRSAWVSGLAPSDQ
jgi:hypothetical protein